jgi:hypothetical protein
MKKEDKYIVQAHIQQVFFLFRFKCSCIDFSRGLSLRQDLKFKTTLDRSHVHVSTREVYYKIRYTSMLEQMLILEYIAVCLRVVRRKLQERPYIAHKIRGGVCRGAMSITR